MKNDKIRSGQKFNAFVIQSKGNGRYPHTSKHHITLGGEDGTGKLDFCCPVWCCKTTKHHVYAGKTTAKPWRYRFPRAQFTFELV